MNTSQRTLCFHISELGVTDFAGISMKTRMDTGQLEYQLGDLVERGFVLCEQHLYKLADGVKASLLDEERGEGVLVVDVEPDGTYANVVPFPGDRADFA